jgi:hypothetical protein
MAPPSENNTERYIAAVEKWSDVPRNKELTAANSADYTHDCRRNEFRGKRQKRRYFRGQFRF